MYSFGVLLLELLSGTKAIISSDRGLPFVITEWTWALVREGKT